MVPVATRTRSWQCNTAANIRDGDSVFRHTRFLVFLNAQPPSPREPKQEHLDPMEDVQNRTDERQVPIDQVGVCDLGYPITVLDRNHEKQHTIGRLTLSVSLPH